MDNFSVVGWATEFLSDCPTQNLDVQMLNQYLKEGRFFEYLNHSLVTPFDDPDYPLAYLAQSLLKKFPFPGFSKQARSKAVERFFLAEEMCKATNRRLANLKRTLPDSECDFWAIPFLERARSYIREVLGECVPYDRVLREATFTDGTDSANPYGFTSAYHKYAARPQATIEARDFATIFINCKPRWASRVGGSQQGSGEEYSYRPISVVPSAIDLIPGNRVSFVPKNAKTDRAIAVEPHMNVYMQRAVGRVIRSNLKRVGVDLKHGQSTNGDLAMLGSATGLVSTIDLSMASDTVSRFLVEWLLPPNWFTLLDSLRSKHSQMPDGTWRCNEKFSSMGNGFTFELETLIFWALIKSVIPAGEWRSLEFLVSVYGDDLILPSRFSEKLIQVLAVCGFETNRDKTFLEGPFRESCGKDYLYGKNIRPFLISEDFGPHHRRAFYKLANSLRLYCGHFDHSINLRRWLHRHWVRIVSNIRNPHYVPLEYGPEQGLHVRLDEHGFEFDRVSGWWNIRFLTPVPDERSLEIFYKEKKRPGQHRRKDYHLLLMMMLSDSDHLNHMEYLYPDEGNADCLLNFSKGNPVRYVTISAGIGFFSEPVPWSVEE